MHLSRSLILQNSSGAPGADPLPCVLPSMHGTSRSVSPSELVTYTDAYVGRQVRCVYLLLTSNLMCQPRRALCALCKELHHCGSNRSDPVTPRLVLCLATTLTLVLQAWCSTSTV